MANVHAELALLADPTRATRGEALRAGPHPALRCELVFVTRYRPFADSGVAS